MSKYKVCRTPDAGTTLFNWESLQEALDDIDKRLAELEKAAEHKHEYVTPENLETVGIDELLIDYSNTDSLDKRVGISMEIKRRIDKAAKPTHSYAEYMRQFLPTAYKLAAREGLSPEQVGEDIAEQAIIDLKRRIKEDAANVEACPNIRVSG